MAMFHSHTQVITRSSGRSAVAAAAYRSGTRLLNERDGTIHDYSRKTGVLHSEIVLPDAAPARWLDRETLWNEVERSERSSNAQLAREIEYSLPREFDLPMQVAFARAYAKCFADEGMIADFSIHAGKNGNGNNHVHMLLSMRPCDESGFTAKSENAYLVRDVLGDERHATASELKALGDGWAKVYSYRNGEQLTQAEAEAVGLHPTRDRKSKTPIQETRYLMDWNEPTKVAQWREHLSRMQNEWLEAIGVEDRVDHRSYAERGVDQVPTLHEGPTVRHVEHAARKRAARVGRQYRPVTERRRENMRIAELNRRMREMVEKMKRSFTSFRRNLQAAGHGQSDNARKRALQAQRAGQRTARQRDYDGMSR